MSKGSKRRSAKQIERDFQHVAPVVESQPPPVPEKPWLTMTDDEIDQEYFHFGRADRTRMKREAAQERLRVQVREALESEG